VRRWRFALGGAVFGAVLALGLAAIATIPDSAGVIHGCYVRSGASAGTLRVINAPNQSCKSTERALNWSQQGPPGPTGSAGAVGVPQPYRVNESLSFGSRIPSEWSVSCLPGDVLLNGGYRFSPYPSGYQGAEWEAGVPALAEIMGAHAAYVPTEDRWEYQVTSRSLNGDAYTLTLFVYCAPKAG
jgi:hypothetical protein